MSDSDLEDGELPADSESQQLVSSPVRGGNSHSHSRPASPVPDKRGESSHRARSHAANTVLPAYETGQLQQSSRFSSHHRRESLPRQAADLTAAIKEATSQVTVKHGITSPETLCNNLWTAVQSCQALCRALSESASDASTSEKVISVGSGQVDNLAKTADNHALIREMSGRLLSGLRTLDVVSGTGAGRSTFTQTSRAADIIRTIMSSRTKLFTAARRLDVEKLVASSKVFSAMLSEGSESEKSAGLDSLGSRKRPRLEFGDASVVPSFLSLPERERGKRASTPTHPDTPQLQTARSDKLHQSLEGPPALARIAAPPLQSASPGLVPGKTVLPIGGDAHPADDSGSSHMSSGEILISSKQHDPMEADLQSALADTAAGPARPSTPQSPDSKTSAQKPPVPKAAKLTVTNTAIGHQLLIPGLAANQKAQPSQRAQANGRPLQQAAAMTPPPPPSIEPPSPPSSPLLPDLPPPPPEISLLPDINIWGQQTSGPLKAALLPPMPPDDAVGRPPSPPKQKGLPLTASPAEGSRPACPMTVLRAPPAVDVLLRQSKLCLVLDLDHTLVNSARFSEVSEPVLALIEQQHADEQGRLPPEQRLLHRLPHISMWTKLRPAVRLFLERAALFFQLWIHTNGNRTYALAIAQLLDPTGQLFQGRIIAQGAEDGAMTTTTKRLMQGLEDLESIALVVDDTSSVWHHHADSLLTVERYVFFPSSKQALGMTGESYLESRRDEHGETGMLAMALQVLMCVHMRVFRNLSDPTWHAQAAEDAATQPPWDVRVALRTERAKVLQGTVIVFSGFTPMNMRPEQHHLWVMAESFGARCTTAKADDVTHVVARQGGTEKVFWAKHSGKWVVSKGWCAECPRSPCIHYCLALVCCLYCGMLS